MEGNNQRIGEGVSLQSNSATTGLVCQNEDGDWEVRPSTSGATAGATAGAVIAGPVGAAVGGIIGGILGFFFGPAD